MIAFNAAEDLGRQEYLPTHGAGGIVQKLNLHL